MNDLFSELDDTEQQASKNTVPFWKLPYEETDAASEEKVKIWLTNEKDHLLRVNKERFQIIKKNLALNKGIMYTDQEVRNSETRETSLEVKKKAVQKIVINVLREANRVRASRILKYKPAVAVLPTNDELADKVDAEMCEKLLSHIWYTQRFEGEKLPKIVDAKGPMGEAYLWIEWNPELGDLHDDYKKAQKYAKEQKLPKVPLLDGNGKPEEDENGKVIYVDKPVRNGDVDYTVDFANNCLFQRPPSRQFKDSEYVFRRKLMSVEKARLKWPKAATKIKANKDTQIYDYDNLSTYTDPNMVEVWYFFHKRTDEFEKGRFVVFTADGVLDSTEFPYSHRNLPLVRWTDLENPGEMHGVSFFEDAKGPAGAFNNITNMILRNEIMVGSPKWMMPAGAARIEELGNAITVVQFKGPRPPQLVQANPTGQGAYNLRNTLQEEIFRQADISRTGNGEPPQGVTAAVAMQYLAELEAERWNAPVLDHNEAILQSSIMTLCVAGDYYDASDKRMMRVEGKDGQWMSEFFQFSSLNKDYDVRIQNTSALPESKAARIETLLYMAKNFPEQVDPEQILDMFDFAQSKKFVKEGTLSVRAAEAENEMILSNKPVGAPAEYEDQIMHWKIHVKKMREWSFKNRTPKELKQKLEDHLAAHEMIMVKLATKDANFAQQIKALPGFPLFFKALPEPSTMPQSNPMNAQVPPQDEPYNAGDPITSGPEEPTQEPGEPVAPVYPPMEDQLGLEQTAQEPTSAG